MAKESKSQKAQAETPPDEPETAAETAEPALEPAQSSPDSNGANAMTDAMPSQEPPAESVSEVSSSGAEAMPTLSPEDAGAAGAGAQGGVAAWLNNKRVGALWSINQNRNSWVHITGVGWKKLANNSDTAVVALTTLAASAKHTQTSYNYREEADGMIHETYVW